VNRPQIVIDTNVFVAALLSQFGASFALLMLVDSGKFVANLSVLLALEYEDVGNRLLAQTKLTSEDFEDILDYVCTSSNHHEIYFLWRPFLKDPKDDMVLELAVAASCEYIVTFNQKDFEGAEKFGVKVIEPKAFLKRIGELK
jgi:putative PIN family toxin of toxin-antitoxin system